MFKKGDKLIPKENRTFSSLVYSHIEIKDVTDDNYIVQSGLPLSKKFIENNYELPRRSVENEDGK